VLHHRIFGDPVSGGVHHERSIPRNIQPELLPAAEVFLPGLRGRNLIEPHPRNLRRPVAVREQRPAQLLLTADERFAPEDIAQLLQAISLGLSKRVEGALEARSTSHAGVDLIGGVMVFEDHPRLANAGDREQSLSGIVGHQVGEVRGTERCREPEPHVHRVLRDPKVRDEHQVRNGLV
jgi:hypothetical protein